jgi:hypothetical protein
MDRNAWWFQSAVRRAAAAAVGLAGSLIVGTAIGDEPEHGITEPVLRDDPGDQYAPSIVAGDLGYLVTWVDRSVQETLLPPHRYIRGARVAPNGAPVTGDEQGFSLGSAWSSGPSDFLDGPSVAFGGGSYLVAWTSIPIIQMALVAPSGPSPVLVTASLPYNEVLRFYPVVARADATFVLVWIETKDGMAYSLRGARVDATGGSLTLGEPFSIAELTLEQGASFLLRPALACADAGCLAVYSDSVVNNIYGAFIKSDNTVLPSFLISGDVADPQKPQDGQQVFPAVAFDGTNYIVVWMSLGPDGFEMASVRGTRVDLNGAVLDPGGVEIASLGTIPQISARAGSPALVTWATPVALGLSSRAARIDTATGITLLPPGSIPLDTMWQEADGLQVPVALDSTGMEGLAVSSVVPFGPIPTDTPRRDILVSTVETSPALSVTAATTISKNWNHQMGPAVTSIGNNPNSSKGNGYLVVWKDSDYNGAGDGLAGLAVSRLNDKGKALPVSQPVSIDMSIKYAATLSVAAGPDNILIGWIESDPPFIGKPLSLQAALASHDGEIVSLTPIPISTGEVLSGSDRPDLSAAFDGSAYVLVWSTGNHVRASRLSAGGDVLEAGVLVHEVSPQDQQGSVWNVASAYAQGGDFLTFWSNDIGIFCKGFSTVSDKIILSSSDPKMLAELSSSTKTELAVAYDPDGAALLVWRNNTPKGNNDLYGTRVSKSCESLDGGFPIAQGDTYKENPRVIFDGESYLAVWRESSAIYGAWISRNGIPHASSGFPVAEAGGYMGEPAVATDGAGRSLIAFSRSHFTDDETGLRFDVDRVRVKLINNDCKYPDVVSCQPEDPCFVGGVCNPETLNCSPSSPQPDGAPCPGGLCIGGDCVPDSILPASSGASVGASGGGNPIEGDGGCACEAVGAGRRGGAPAGLFAAIAALLATSRAGRARRGRSAYT